MNTNITTNILKIIILGGITLYSALVTTIITFGFDHEKIVCILLDVLSSPNLFLYLGILSGVSIFIVLLFLMAQPVSIEPIETSSKTDDLVFEVDTNEIDDSTWRSELSKQSDVKVNHSAVLSEKAVEIAIKDFLKRNPELKDSLNKSECLEIELLNDSVPVEATFDSVKISWK